MFIIDNPLTENNPHADVRDVNQSPAANRCTNGTKCVSKSCGLCCCANARNESTAFSRTTVSSTVDRLSNGGSRQWACSGPPTNGIKLPNCSASANSTSSSSYIVSVRNGISSLRVRSTPNANAIVDSFLIELRRN